MSSALSIFASLVVDAFRQLRADSRRKRIAQAIRQEMDEYQAGFTHEELVYVHQRVGEKIDDLCSVLGPQHEQDMEDPPQLTPVQLVEELQHWGDMARDMGLPFVVGVQIPGYTRIYMSSNITPSHTDTQIMCAYHDLSR